MPDNGKMIVRCPGCKTRLLVKAALMLAAGKVYCPRCMMKKSQVSSSSTVPKANDDQIVAWLREGEPDDRDEALSAG